MRQGDDTKLSSCWFVYNGSATGHVQEKTSQVHAVGHAVGTGVLAIGREAVKSISVSLCEKGESAPGVGLVSRKLWNGGATMWLQL